MMNIWKKSTVRAAICAAAALLTATSSARLDASPSLYFYDALFYNNSKLFFQNKHIWITGASSGIGRELAHQLSRTGASLIISARNSHKLEHVKQECLQRGAKSCRVLVMDVSNVESLPAVVDSLDDQLDIAILNAGIGHLGLASETSTQTTRTLWEVNTLGPIVLSQLLLRKWSSNNNKRPHLVVTSSVASQFPVPLSASYAATKHAVHGYFSSLRAENPTIRVDLPRPGPIQTDFFHGSKSNDDENKSTTREMKMPVSRCARLMLSSIMMTSKHGVDHTIAQQPTLLFGGLHRHFPSLSNWLLHNIVAPTRVGMYQQGLNVYDPQAIKKYRREKKKQE